MFRLSAIVLAAAVLALVASSVVWLRSTTPVTREAEGDPNTFVADFERAHRPLRTIDVGARCAVSGTALHEISPRARNDLALP